MRRPGDWEAGDRGLASLPGREHEFSASIVTALRYAQALRCPRVHVMSGLLPEDADAEERERRLRMMKRNLALCLPGGRRAERHRS
jgi:hydroxypyruvate isomerase